MPTGSASENNPVHHRDVEPDTPHARPAEHIGENEKPDQLANKARETRNRQEALIDESVEETFPASDPPAAKQIT